MNEDLKTKVDIVLDELRSEALGEVDEAIYNIVREALLSQRVGVTPQDTMLAARELFDRAQSRINLWNERKPEDAQKSRKRAKEDAEVRPAMSLDDDKNIGHTPDLADKSADAKPAKTDEKTGGKAGSK